MSKHWCYFLFMLWFTYLIVSSILLFSRGFLLSKNAQNTNSTCIPISQVPCLAKDTTISTSHEETCTDNAKLSNLLQNVDSASNICLPQKARIILVIIDALRYDFAVFDDTLTNPDYFQNRLPIINTLLKQYPDYSRLYKFMADPPTTTMQRLKGLTTGSLPTFIDAGSNFATNEINEDNIIDQLLRHNLSTVLIGDDTWDGLYPDRFLRKYPYPSFDVWDLDTVDDGVHLHLREELHQQDWDLLIAHYLGVDHCGHRYGPSHPEMDRKLTEMNTVIENIVKTLDSNTMLFVIGDHGMTETGNHGGDAEDEVTAAFFIHSKKSLFSLNNSTDKVRQISIVPTMAAIFGVSTPFSNLGTIILDALPIVNSSYIQDWQLSLFYLWGNVQQMLNYIEDYAATSSETFSYSDLKEFKEHFGVLNAELGRVDEAGFEDFVGKCMSFLTNVRERCEKVWIQFDAFSMTRGLLFLFLSLFFVYMITDGIPSDRLPEIFMSSFLTCSYSALFLSAGLAGVLYYFNFVSNLISTAFFLTGLVSQFMLVMLVIQNWELISLNWYDRSKKDWLIKLICRIVLIMHLGGLFSNSFVVEESSVLLFLLASLVIIGTLSVCQSDSKKKKIKWKLIFMAVAALVLIRISMYFWRCRDRLEQPWCYNSYNAFTSKSETTKLQWITTVIILALFVTVTKTWLKNCGNLNDYSFSVILLKYVPTVLVVCTSGYWVLNRLPVEGKHKSFQPWQTNALAWIVYGLSSLGIFTVFIKPLYVYIVPGSTEVPVENESNVIPELFHKVKKLFNEPSREDIPIVCGLGTAFSAAFIALGIYLTHLFALLHGDAAAPSTIIMFLSAVLILAVTAIIRLQKASSIEQLFEIPNISLLIWVFLAQYFFYGTGHQPSFPNIIWEAAFVGTSGVFRHNFILGSLIIINTFCSQILMGLLLPLHLIVPFTVSLMMPSMTNRNVLERENLRGEVLLYERSSLMLTVAFTTSCKYMICHGIRVFATMLTATIHCRHMMIWKIFAPKFIFESVGMFVTLAMVNLSYLVLIRINSKVDGLVTSLNKRFN